MSDEAPKTDQDIAALAKGGRTNFFGFVIRLVDQIRAAIKGGEFDELRAHVLGQYYSTRAQ